MSELCTKMELERGWRSVEGALACFRPVRALELLAGPAGRSGGK